MWLTWWRRGAGAGAHHVMVALWLKAVALWRCGASRDGGVVALWRCGGVAKASDVTSREVAWTVAGYCLASRDLP